MVVTRRRRTPLLTDHARDAGWDTGRRCAVPPAGASSRVGALVRVATGLGLVVVAGAAGHLVRAPIAASELGGRPLEALESRRFARLVSGACMELETKPAGGSLDSAARPAAQEFDLDADELHQALVEHCPHAYHRATRGAGYRGPASRAERD